MEMEWRQKGMVETGWWIWSGDRRGKWRWSKGRWSEGRWCVRLVRERENDFIILIDLFKHGPTGPRQTTDGHTD